MLVVAVDGTLLVRVGVLPANVKDYGYFEAGVHPTTEWQHFNLNFASLYQPGWFVQTPFDLSAVTQIGLTPLTNGDFEFDLDNIRLEGPTPLILDDFESGGANALGGYPGAGGSGDGTESTSVTMTFAAGGPASSTKYAAISGTLFQGWDAAKNISWGNMTEGLAGSNLTSYTGISFDMRGQLKNLDVLAINGNSPIVDHNASCAFTGETVPACALDQGTVIDGVTNGFSGTAPDLGTYESGAVPFVPGAVRSSDPSTCGKVADITPTLPPQAKNPWSPAPANSDAGAEDAGDDAGTPIQGSVGKVQGGGGCNCRFTASHNTSRGLFAATALFALGMMRRRRIRRHFKYGGLGTVDASFLQRPFKAGLLGDQRRGSG